MNPSNLIAGLLRLAMLITKKKDALQLAMIMEM
jgi:hypothetical protein